LRISFTLLTHYDKAGFYATQLSELPDRISFLQTLYKGGFYGPGRVEDFGDVERLFRHHPWIHFQIQLLEARLAARAPTPPLLTPAIDSESPPRYLIHDDFA
jgi:hypothetical protein